MALTVAELNARLTADTKQFHSAMGKAEKQSSKFAGVFKTAMGTAVGIAAARGGAAVLQFGKDSVKAASDLEEAANKSMAVFGSAAGVISQWAAGAAEDFGLSERAALDAAGSFGNMFRQLGVGAGEAATMSTAITELAADFASFHNADIEQVIQAQSAAFRGEYDALQRFLPLINAATVEQKALAMTGKTSNKELTAQEKALAVNALMFEGAGKAAGDFDRTSESLANSQRSAAAAFEDAQAKLGSALQPAMQKITQFMASSFIPGAMKLAEVIGEGIADAAGFAIGAIADFLSAMNKAGGVINKLIPAFDPIPDASGLVSDLRNIEAGLHDMQSSFSGATVAAEEHAGANDRAAESYSRLEAAQAGVATATESLAEAQTDLADSQVELRDAQISARDANLAVEDAIRDAAEAQDEYNRLVATGGIDVDKLNAAQEKLVDTQNELEEANKKVLDAHEEIKKALEPADSRDLSRAQRDLEDAQDDVTRAGIRLGDAQQDLNELRMSGEATADELALAEIAVRDAERALADAEDRVIDKQNQLNELKKVGTADSDAYKTAVQGLKVAEDQAAVAAQNVANAQQAVNAAQQPAAGFADRLAEAERAVRDANNEVADRTWAAEKATKALRDAQFEAKAAADQLRASQDAVAQANRDVKHSSQEAETAVLNMIRQLFPETVGPDFIGPISPFQRQQGTGGLGGWMRGLLTMHDGGTVPGPSGADVPIMAQAGERVIPADGGGMAGVTVVVNGNVLDGRQLADLVQDALLSKQRRTGSLGFN